MSEQWAEGMTVTAGLPRAVRIDGEGVEFAVAWGKGATKVEITVEYPDYSGRSIYTCERFLTLTAEQWAAVVAFIEAERLSRMWVRRFPDDPW